MAAGGGAGAGAAVAAVAVDAGLRLAGPAWWRSGIGDRRVLAAYGLVGALAAATVGPWLVVLLLACGVIEVVRRRAFPRLPGRGSLRLHPAGLLAAVGATVATGGLGALAWTSLKVGALAYGGGFVIVPLMQGDAVDRYGWMTDGQFLNAVALGQVTPGPVTHTVAAVGYSAAGVGGALFAAAIAFAPSFAFVLLGAEHFDRLLADRTARAFIDGAAPAAIGAILGSAIPLAQALSEGWQVAVLAGAAVLLVLRRGVVTTLVLAGAAGALAAVLGAPLPV